MPSIWRPLRTDTAPSGTRSVRIAGRDVPVALKPNGRARRIIVRMDRQGAGVRVTVPPGVGEREALDFVLRCEGWIRERLAARADAVPFAPGVQIPIAGVPHEIVHLARRRGTVRRAARAGAGPALLVPGDAAHVARRVTDWLKREARRALEQRCDTHARTLGLAYARLHVRDQTSRWGSCSSTGTLSFSWRLIMTPEHVLDYVAAHEVAHLAEMNHSRRFWGLVDRAVPDMKASRAWLRRHGPSLHLYGRAE